MDIEVTESTLDEIFCQACRDVNSIEDMSERYLSEYMREAVQNRSLNVRRKEFPNKEVGIFIEYYGNLGDDDEFYLLYLESDIYDILFEKRWSKIDDLLDIE